MEEKNKISNEVVPHAKRAGNLRNGNPSGDPSKAPRCGARTRRKSKCMSPAMRNGRCRMHGGASTGPKTKSGKRNSARANLRHGRFQRSAIEARKRTANFFRQCKRVLREMAVKETSQSD